MVQNLMVACVEHRFQTAPAPRQVEWLTDNGSCFTAEQTVKCAGWLGLTCCFTPVRSPESNGMAESFVKTFKRDYVFCHDRPDVRSVLSQLEKWFRDYNEVAPLTRALACVHLASLSVNAQESCSVL